MSTFLTTVFLVFRFVQLSGPMFLAKNAVFLFKKMSPDQLLLTDLVQISRRTDAKTNDAIYVTSNALEFSTLLWLRVFGNVLKIVSIHDLSHSKIDFCAHVVYLSFESKI